MMVLHDPTNIMLTKHCINLMKGNHGPASIPILKRCYQLAQQPRTAASSWDYEDETKEEWEQIHRVSRRQYR